VILDDRKKPSCCFAGGLLDAITGILSMNLQIQYNYQLLQPFLQYPLEVMMLDVQIVPHLLPNHLPLIPLMNAETDNPQHNLKNTIGLQKHVEQALRDYHRPSRLTQNPVIHQLDLTPFRRLEDSSFLADGLALRRALCQAMTVISGRDANTSSRFLQWCLQDYLLLRYREGISHKDIAQRMGYSERHLLNLRKELIVELTEVLLEAEFN
jgi:hypothetical protein